MHRIDDIVRYAGHDWTVVDVRPDGYIKIIRAVADGTHSILFDGKNVKPTGKTIVEQRVSADIG